MWKRHRRDVSLVALPGGQFLKFSAGVMFLKPGEDISVLEEKQVGCIQCSIVSQW